MRIVEVSKLKPGFIVGRPLTDEKGSVLLNSGVQLTEAYIRILQAKGFTRLFVKDPEAVLDVEPDEDVSPIVRGRAFRALKECYDSIGREVGDVRTRSIEDLRAVCRSDAIKSMLARHGPLSAMEDLVSRIMDEVLSHSVLAGLTSLKAADARLYEHSLDVCIVSIMVGRAIGMPMARLKQAAMGSMVHDIGMVFVEPGLSEDRRIRQHTLLGYELLKASDNPDILAPHAALEHHERQDGTGLPRGLVGSNRVERDRNLPPPIPTLLGEVAAVANVYDNLLTGTAATPAMMPDQALEVIRAGAGTQFNREVVNSFLRVVPVYPVGTEVLLRGDPYRNYTAVVTEVMPGRLDRPIVTLTHNNSGERIDPITLDLAADDRYAVRSRVG